MMFFTSEFFIADLYEFNTNNCLQASISTKFCMFFNTNAQNAHTCVAVLTPDSLTVKYFMTLCMFVYSFSECSEATQTCLPEEVSFQVRNPELKST